MKHTIGILCAFLIGTTLLWGVTETVDIVMCDTEIYKDTEDAMLEPGTSSTELKLTYVNDSAKGFSCTANIIDGFTQQIETASTSW